ncbi:unnamed protein product [Mytilus coruscus]|uniref:Endonuclease/exonuclease/phosphatase domain-containing protein n=1 Tax=Mytilus coruscus TaxID=42192 RepID=A0A6J8EXD2_MYTCO|nr:unnamed protein product [Mytilus coruscus]
MNVSDHHPIQMTFVLDFSNATLKQRKSSNSTPKIKWDKMDMDLYKAMVDTSSKVIVEKLSNNQIGLEKSIRTTCEVMANSAIKCSSIKSLYNAKPKLKGYVPDLLQIGLLTTIFKNKGSKNDAGNYRGKTVQPVVSKVIDTVLKNRTQPSVKSVQHKYQRGFTSGSGPMNSALPVEEVVP